MTLDEFLDLVAAMRRAQKQYFRSRDRAAMDLSMELERRVDRAIVELQDKQPTLFGGDS